jgi:hypothetical protein
MSRGLTLAAAVPVTLTPLANQAAARVTRPRGPRTWGRPRLRVSDLPPA